MANMKQKVNNHNRQITSNGREREEFTRTCNCREKNIMSTKREMPSRGSCVQSHRHTIRIDEAGYIHRDDGKPL